MENEEKQAEYSFFDNRPLLLSDTCPLLISLALNTTSYVFALFQACLSRTSPVLCLLYLLNFEFVGDSIKPYFLLQFSPFFHTGILCKQDALISSFRAYFSWVTFPPSV
jgi:hypothetical protein